MKTNYMTSLKLIYLPLGRKFEFLKCSRTCSKAYCPCCHVTLSLIDELYNPYQIQTTRHQIIIKCNDFTSEFFSNFFFRNFFSKIYGASRKFFRCEIIYLSILAFIPKRKNHQKCVSDSKKHDWVCLRRLHWSNIARFSVKFRKNGEFDSKISNEATIRF